VGEPREGHSLAVGEGGWKTAVVKCRRSTLCRQAGRSRLGGDEAEGAVGCRLKSARARRNEGGAEVGSRLLDDKEDSSVIQLQGVLLKWPRGLPFIVLRLPH
jgi:hypothetical protein